MIKKKNILIFLSIVIIIALIYFLWSLYTFYRPVDYVTRRPIYHEYFPMSSTSSRGIRVSQGKAQIDFRTTEGGSSRRVKTIIIDMETGRELMRFESDRRSSYRVFLQVDGTVFVSRQARESFFNRSLSTKRALIDIETGDELVSFDSEFRMKEDFNTFSNGLAIIRDPSCMWTYGVLDVESGEMTVPFDHENIYFASSGNGLMIASIEERDTRDTRGVRERWGVIDGNTGEILWPFQYESIWCFPPDAGAEGGLFRLSYEIITSAALVDSDTGEVLIPADSQYQPQLSAGYGFVEVSHDELDRRTRGLIEIQSGEIIIPFGKFNHIRILNEEVVLVEIGRGENHQTGIINIHSGEEVVPIGKYLLRTSLWRYYYNGLMIIEQGYEQAVIDVTTGEKVIPFGIYNIVRMLEGGFITVVDGDYWKIVSVR